MVDVRKLTPHIGAEVTGVDIRNLDEATFAVLYRAFLDNIILVIRGDKNLSMEEYLEYGRRWGPLKPHLVKKQRHPVYPELMMMDNGIGKPGDVTPGTSPEALRKRGVGFHTDLTYEASPAKATHMYSKAVTSSGGDTLFASGYAAYDTLPDSLKQRIEGVAASYTYVGRRTGNIFEIINKEDHDMPPAIHPFVRVHPETGRKALYFDPLKLVEVIGMERAAGDDLVAELRERYVHPDAQYRHKWQVEDFVMWDNRCAVHSATGDYPQGERRAFWRLTIMEYDWRDARMSA